MDGKRIINVAYPRNPVENSTYNGDVVTAKALSEAILKKLYVCCAPTHHF